MASEARVIDLQAYRRRRQEPASMPGVPPLAWQPPVLWWWVWVPVWPM
jgi:hypothetical protein